MIHYSSLLSRTCYMLGFPNCSGFCMQTLTRHVWIHYTDCLILK